MKVIHEKDYTYLGTDGQWHVFESVPRKNFYPERLLECAARFVLKDGSSKFYDPIELADVETK